MRILTVAQMKETEAMADAAGYSYSQMMQTAGIGVARRIDRLYRKKNSDNLTCVGLIGSGNNGGDGLVALTELNRLGWRTSAFIPVERSGDPLVDAFRKTGSEIFVNDAAHEHVVSIENAGIIMDGLLGTGIKLPLRENMAEFLRAVNSINNRGKVIAIDCPSGVDCVTGEAAKEAIRADRTLCIEAVKQGLLAFPAWKHVGMLDVVPLNIPEQAAQINAACSTVITADQAAKLLPKRPSDCHKGTFGRALVVAGSINYIGAAAFSIEGALRAGAGLVEGAVPESIHAIVASSVPEAVWSILPDHCGSINSGAVSVVLRCSQDADSLLIGPGIGSSKEAFEFLEALLNGKSQGKSFGYLNPGQEDHHNPLPVKTVFDADGLRHLAKIDSWQTLLPEDTVITPHPGEFSALTGIPVPEIQANRIYLAAEYASKWKVTVVLKGAFTVVANSAGESRVMPLATSALAHAGTGDVLAGLITGFMAQGLSGFEAATLAVYFHGKAGALAAKRAGQSYTVLARNVIECLPKIMSKLSKKAGG